ncbi:acyl-CoA dehydrogenase family protein [Paenarthrobacter sp. Z7-10]|uniref:acyl-CoA dehydrogenase family protein n=1 Tax=Paenarthrobacter sp. Z7-10 TaxID=2787635 RepID=UPI002E77BD21|nr:acyl-CoA dehydrogenase family protein [Paenarthrobacter sp. Z7-10]
MGKEVGIVEQRNAGAVNVDYFALDDDLTEDERALRDRVRAFAASDVLPIINDYWERAQFPFELLPGLARLGIVGGTIEGYGCPGLSRRTAGIASREMARGDGSVNTFLGVHSSLCMGAINMLGSEEQKQRWLPVMATLANRRVRADGAAAWFGLGGAGDERAPGRGGLHPQRSQKVDRQRRRGRRRRNLCA